MNLLEELRNLDPQDPGRWPFAVRAGAAGVWLVALAVLLSYFLVWQQQQPLLQKQQQQEEQLRNEFRNKHAKAANLAIYHQQLAEIERSFGALLRQLPGRTEVPNLLVDISQVGLAAGLEENLFQPGNEVRRDFYAELPIKIRLSGTYHQFGEFVSGIALLPRIVTLHDIDIKQRPREGFDRLTLDVTAKTYRYLDEEELAAADAERRKQDQGRRRPNRRTT
jgi:type IV pilus assembly protein PilO